VQGLRYFGIIALVALGLSGCGRSSPPLCPGGGSMPIQYFCATPSQLASAETPVHLPTIPGSIFISDDMGNLLSAVGKTPTISQAEAINVARKNSNIASLQPTHAVLARLYDNYEVTPGTLVRILVLPAPTGFYSWIVIDATTGSFINMQLS
jgi:hypothetical protein